MEQSNQDERPIDMQSEIWRSFPNLTPYYGHYKEQKWHVRLFRWLFRRPEHKKSEYVKGLLDYRKSSVDSTVWYEGHYEGYYEGY